MAFSRPAPDARDVSWGSIRDGRLRMDRRVAKTDNTMTAGYLPRDCAMIEIEVCAVLLDRPRHKVSNWSYGNRSGGFQKHP